MRLLFVCNQGRHRSKTAAQMFCGVHETRAAGLYSSIPLREEDLLWAQLVVVMDDEQRREIARRFPAAYLAARIVSLDIPDVYAFDQPRLRELLLERMSLIEQSGLFA